MCKDVELRKNIVHLRNSQEMRRAGAQEEGKKKER